MKVYTLPIRLPGLNEYQHACRRHPLAGAQMKKNAINLVTTYLSDRTKAEWPVQVEIYYTEPNKRRRRDVDNVFGFGAKVILDALVKVGVLPDDGPDYVNKLSQQLLYDDEPEITVVLHEPGNKAFVDMSSNEQTCQHAEEVADLICEAPKEEGCGRSKTKRR